MMVYGLYSVLRKGKKNQVYNIGNNKEVISINELAKKIKNLAKSNVKIIKTNFKNSDRTKEREIFKRFPDLKKIKKDTGFVPRISLDEGIKNLLKKLKSLKKFIQKTIF